MLLSAHVIVHGVLNRDFTFCRSPTNYGMEYVGIRWICSIGVLVIRASSGENVGSTDGKSSGLIMNIIGIGLTFVKIQIFEREHSVRMMSIGLQRKL